MAGRSFVLEVTHRAKEVARQPQGRRKMTPTADTQLHNAASCAISATGSRVGDMVKATAARAFAAFRTADSARASSDKVSDESLVARVAEGDRRAMQLLFVRHQQRVHRFVLLLFKNAATAEDIVSEVFFEVWRQAANFEGRAQLSTWLLAIARNKALSAMRRRIDQPLADALAVADSAITAEETLEARDRSAL